MDVDGFNAVLEKFSFALKFKNNWDSKVAYAGQRDSLISLQLINIFNRYGAKLFFFSSTHKCDSLCQRTGRDFDTTVKFNASTGKEYFH